MRLQRYRRGAIAFESCFSPIQDLPEWFATKNPLNAYARSTLYGDAKGGYKG
jgi:hypothetical protein